MTAREFDRREFLRVTATTAGGILLAIHVPAWPLEASTEAGRAVSFSPNLLVRIDPDGTVTITAPRPEMGQGVRTSLPMLVAEELEVDWDDVRIVQADLDDRFEAYNGQGVGGSYSVRGSWEPLRRAGAAAREMLIAAAAARWGVAPESCEARSARVHHASSGRSLGYGELAADAALLPVPENPQPKEPSRFRLIGTPVPNVDASEIVTGQIGFGFDVRVPGMLFAAIARAPTFDARLRRVDPAPALALPGVRRVIEVDPDSWPDFPPNSPKPVYGVAVIAETTWAALAGRSALDLEWEPGPGATESSERFWQRCEDRAAEAPDRVVREDGDVAGALELAARRVQAVYRVPFLAHAAMEPLNATARVDGAGCEIWVSTQNPAAAREAAALATGLDPQSIVVHPLRMGGAFGRRYYSDYVAEAAYLAREAEAPVQIVWNREDDTRYDLFRPAGHHVMDGGLDGEGRVTAWSHHLTNASRYTSLGRDGPPGAGELYEYDFPAGFVPNYRAAYSAVDSPIPRGQWRAIADSANVFVVESFIDELAHAAGMDPLEFRLRTLGPAREVPYFSRTYDSGRLRRVLQTAADAAGWGGPLPGGHGRGIAASFANTAFVAHVAEVAIDSGGRVRVSRVVSAVDIGTVVNPNGVRAQVEGSMAQALSTVLGERVTVEAGRVTQGNFDDYPLLRIDEMPEVDVQIIPSDGPPRGMGEGALPPLAPAVTNAVFAASGTRIRRLPMGRILDPAQLEG